MAPVTADRRLWRTGDGRLVEDGDADAATLAYAPGDRIAPADLAKVPGAENTPGDPEPEAKQARRPADKARRRGEDK